jgi:leucine dehydrogenase
VVIQGAGHVGAHLARLLVDDGARVAIADIDIAKAHSVGVPVVSRDAVLSADCDVFAPCALGGVLTVESVARLKCSVVCGAANNQLLDEKASEELAARKIAYAPDFVVNAGGIINIAEEWAPGGYSLERAHAATAKIEDTTRRVLTLARNEGITTSRAAEEIGRRRIATEGNAPYRPGDHSVMRDTLVARFQSNLRT